jgi:tRNA G18 (ribose-2'-O)-methylase SpoU
MTKLETNDHRNVIDVYKYWTTEAIKGNLDTKRHNFSVLISNQFKDFNIGTVIRNANAFLAREVIVYGRKQFDRRGTVGTHLYENLKFVKFTEELDLADYCVVGFDTGDDAVPVETFQWPKDKHVVMVFGQEDIGLVPELRNLCERILYIRQYGSVRSLNVGCASSIAMYDYCAKTLAGTP